LALGEDNKGQVYIKGKRNFVVNLWRIWNVLIMQNRCSHYFFPPCVCIFRSFCVKSPNSLTSIILLLCIWVCPFLKLWSNFSITFFLVFTSSQSFVFSIFLCISSWQAK
jgi:hypothetical protein